jgi:hypothetical protein
MSVHGGRRPCAMAVIVFALFAGSTAASVMTAPPSPATPRFDLRWKMSVHQDVAAHVPREWAIIPPHEWSPTPRPVPSGAHTTQASSSQGISWGTVAVTLLSGAGGFVLGFILTDVSSRAHDRREAKAAAQVVRDELSEAVNTLNIGQIPGAVPLPESASAFDTDAFRTYRLLMQRQLKPNTMRDVTAAYRLLRGISVSVLESFSQETRDAMKEDVSKAISALSIHAPDSLQQSDRVSSIRFRWPISFKPASGSPEDRGG